MNSRLTPVCALSFLSGAIFLSVVETSTAQTLAVDVVAAPDVYKVRAEDDRYRMVEGTWKPGQRDALHSHPAMMYYWVTPCSIRWHLPDGTMRDVTVSAGQAGTQPAVAAHSVENISKSECKIVMFEVK